MKKLSLLAGLFVFLSFPLIALAQEHGGHAEEAAEVGVPFTVTLQAINFAIFVAILIWLLRGPVKNYFTNKELNFKQALIKAEAAKQAAITQKNEMAARLNELNQSTEKALADAKVDAAGLKAKMLQEANEMSARLKADAQRTAEFEIARAKTTLREEMLVQSVALAQKMLGDKMADGDQKRLQTEFVEKIQVVR